ncbi:MAG: twin-arginine translocase TatA/TatE family subunit [Flavobacterium sp.]|nr:twin-arginine translocase TatA/TatE family subunit [Flavobacterium sp.]
MFGIDGSELFLIIIVAIMLFGSKNIPEVARNLAKGLAQLKNATNDIKSEITKSAEENGFDVKSLTGGLTEEIDSVKHNIKKMTENSGINQELEGIQQNFRNLTQDIPQDPMHINSITADIDTEINKAKENIEDIATGPIKRQN